MNDEKIYNATITIEEVADKEKKVSLKGNDGSRTSTYSFFKKKRDGTDTSVYAQFKDMGLTAGATVFVGYVIDDYETEIGGIPKRIQSKKIINFREASQGAAPAQKPRTGQNQASGGVINPIYKFPKPEPDWDKLGYIKAYHNLIAAYIAKGETYNQLLEHISNGYLWSLCKVIEEDVDKRTATGWQKAEALFKKDEDSTTPPYIETSDDVPPFDDPDIPF
jgi:hypothetical protein